LIWPTDTLWSALHFSQFTVTVKSPISATVAGADFPQHQIFTVTRWPIERLFFVFMITSIHPRIVTVNKERLFSERFSRIDRA
jgi:hypothetical protein